MKSFPKLIIFALLLIGNKELVIGQKILTNYLSGKTDSIVIEFSGAYCIAGSRTDSLVYIKKNNHYHLSKADSFEYKISYPIILTENQIDSFFILLSAERNRLSYEDFNISLKNKRDFRHRLRVMKHKFNDSGNGMELRCTIYAPILERQRFGLVFNSKLYTRKLYKLKKISSDTLVSLFNNNNYSKAQRTKWHYAYISISFINNAEQTLSVSSSVNRSKAWGLPWSVYGDEIEESYETSNIEITHFVDKYFKGLILPVETSERNIEAIMALKYFQVKKGN